MSHPRVLLRSLAAIVLVFGASCATSFQGSANISRRECIDECHSMGAEVGAYVFMGRYSTACVCVPRSASAEVATEGASAGAAGAVAGVWMQMEEASRARR